MNEACSRLAVRIRDANAVTVGLLSDVIREACWRLPSVRRTKSFDRIEQFVQSCAWTDAALALLALELPQWQVRHIIHDAGEWHCALSRRREIPDWLDQPVEACHIDLSLAILSALVDVQCLDTSRTASSAPSFPRPDTRHYVPLCCDNFA